MNDFKEGVDDRETNGNSEIIDQQNDSTLHTSSPEVLKVENRIMICGTLSDGVRVLGEKARKFLIENNIPESSVVISREITQMERSFYGIMPKHVNSTYFDSRVQDEKPDAQQPTTLMKIVNKLRKDNSTVQKETERKESSTAEPTPEPTLPKGVLVLPNMRYHDPDTFRGMTIPTPYEKIKKLCDKYKVPMIIIQENSLSKDPISEGVIKLLSEKTSI